jgi:hypothetical protein
VRYVDLDSIRGSHDAEARIADAEAARLSVEAETDAAARAELIKANRNCWVAFRPAFERILGRKCWYTESTNPGTDDDVDHYRPKLSVAERPDHGGYWWEALNWKNFRLSCHRANRLRKNPESGDTLGKGDHFPLLVEGSRWMKPSDACREAPALLDPTDPEDPPLITFGVDGRTALAPEHEGNDETAERVEQSRYYLHLDWPAFVEERTALYGRIATRVDDGERLVEAALERREGLAKAALIAVARDLIQMTRPNQPYSAAAFAYISVYRDKIWIKKMVLPNIPGLLP